MATDAERAEQLTYGNATPEQVAEARERARRKLAEADAYWTPERREQAHQAFLARISAA
ncbi:MAG TPA: hypothetical protein VK453_14905 [Micromonosporaceae bacterium]|nr:hypothetical protein [Micromonosporaceae bacterium]